MVFSPAIVFSPEPVFVQKPESRRLYGNFSRYAEFFSTTFAATFNFKKGIPSRSAAPSALGDTWNDLPTRQGSSKQNHRIRSLKDMALALHMPLVPCLAFPCPPLPSYALLCPPCPPLPCLVCNSKKIPSQLNNKHLQLDLSRIFCRFDFSFSPCRWLDGQLLSYIVPPPLPPFWYSSLYCDHMFYFFLVSWVSGSQLKISLAFQWK